jgi:hypothetical protein
MAEKNITSETSRKSFLKEGGQKEDWKKYKSSVYTVKHFRNVEAFYKERAAITDKIIANWQVSSPNLFKEVDEAVSSVNGVNVDFVIFAIEPIVNAQDGTITLGSNGISYNGTGDVPILTAVVPGLVSIPNAVRIDISKDVTVNSTQSSRHGMQYLLNHEAGHFSYLVAKTSDYIKFRIRQNANNIDNDGGHQKDDESGKRAVEYGKNKDIK